ncbi:MAG: hypothetical protein LC740_05795 [Actinobacteria bacterium]|nr:hypothetical protein [Actinomycetota bacterium]
MVMFRYGREYYEEGEYVRHRDAAPGNDLDPVVRIVEDLHYLELVNASAFSFAGRQLIAV